MTKDLERLIKKLDIIVKRFCTDSNEKLIDLLPEFICEIKKIIKEAKQL